MNRPIIVGLIGGIASGKSTVAKMLEARGGLWLNSDRMAHEVLRSQEVVAMVVQRFGDSVLDSAGQIDRQAIAERVFGDDPESQANLQWLESVIHPRVRALTESRIAGDAGQHRFAVVDAPLLLEAGWGPKCDRILFVDTPQAKRIEFAAARGWSAQELARREASQWSLDKKRAQASDILPNHGSVEELQQAVDQFVFGLSHESTGR